MGAWQIEERVEALAARGVEIVDPRQTYVAPDVSPQRVCSGVVLHPGTRLRGARTFLGPGVEVGAEGPATLVDAVLGPRARIDSGYVEGAVLLDDARAGYGAHLRPGTLLEEEASTAHCVGLKHTILLSFVTLGSLINFCDVLMAGGSSRKDHSEVGSGFIHFNFTPWGARGDKATASLVGDVVHGVFLREPRIFLGGAGGLVGPTSVGYGSVTGAGQVVRRPVADGRLVIETLPKLDRPLSVAKLDKLQPRMGRNVAYVAQLVALRAWYQHVRLARVPSGDEHHARRMVLTAALETLDACIAERVTRLSAFVAERGGSMPALQLEPPVPPCPLPIEPGASDHVAWVKGLDAGAVEAGIAWLTGIASAVAAEPAAAPVP
ncbi:MAG: UDP-N-acetylglucosamine pyrophosphorylase [Myxococcales bacterium]|nr:UDP-N-acetylglucosamine pyrophosphorylase [Myxococcales bacterium]MCB9715147.1 UDP-N-acetylglucosamine pyrophosphorylase [Myxococcales bacterium]